MVQNNKTAGNSRVLVAVGAVASMMVLGTVYAWSVYKMPLMQKHGWPAMGVGFTFSLAILFLGISAAVGGRFIDRVGAGRLAKVSAVLVGGGMILAALADRIGELGLLWLGYGVLGGIGNGIGYITLISVLVRWFPDKKGTVTGFAVMGFGLGAAIMGQVSPILIERIGTTMTLMAAGIFCMGVQGFAAMLIKNPPAVYAGSGGVEGGAEVSIDVWGALGTRQFYILWGAMFCNIIAGIALIGNLSPLAQYQVGISPVTAGTVVLLGSLSNGVGRLFWGYVSEKLGRARTFAIILVTQIPFFAVLPYTHSLGMFSVACCYILFCYGGAFGVMPSFTADTFGSRYVGGIYGMILIAWGLGGGLGPLLIEVGRQKWGSFAIPLYIAAGMLAAGVIMILFYRKIGKSDSIAPV